MKIQSLGLGGAVVVLTFSLAWAEKGKAVVTGTQPGVKVSGLVTVEETSAGLKIDAEFTKAPPGKHAFHIHEFGSCDDQAKAAGSHYNPANHPHGDLMKEGIEKTHAGDFGNVTIEANGQGALHTVIPGLTLSSGEYSVAGRAFVLHEKLDDFSQPVGNAGNRIGCGPIIIVGK